MIAPCEYSCLIKYISASVRTPLKQSWSSCIRQDQYFVSVPIATATLHELTGDSAPKADANFGAIYLMAFIVIHYYA